MSVRSSTRMRHDKSDAFKMENTIAISTFPNANGNIAISAQTMT